MVNWDPLELDDADDAPSRRPSLKDVADLAGVAVSSASRVLSNHPDVSPAMRRRVAAAVTALNYEPDFLAQSLRRGKTLSVGFVVRDISSPLLAEIALGAELTLGERGYLMPVMNSGGEPARDAEHIRFLDQRRADGLLISLGDEANAEALAAIASLSVPVVLIDRDVEVAGASAVVADHVGGMSAILEHLASLGHKRVGLAAAPLRVRPGRVGAAAFLEGCEALGMDPSLQACDAFASQAGFEAAERLLSAPSRPTALIAGSNQIFPGVFLAVKHRGLRIPVDVSIATFDDLPLLGTLDPPIDVVTRQPKRFGEIAAELILALMAGEAPRTILVPTIFEARGSSAPPPMVATSA